MDHTNTSAVFRADYTINSVSTSDSGLYTCTVTNPLGSDTATIAVINAGMYVLMFFEYQLQHKFPLILFISHDKLIPYSIIFCWWKILTNLMNHY